jgi:hypothetical protein
METDAGADRDGELIERAVLNDCEEGRRIAASFVKVFGDYVSNEVRPILREFASDGGQPQLLINGLAELMRSTAASIEFPLDHPRAGAPSLLDGRLGDAVDLRDDGGAQEAGAAGA